MGLNPFLFFVFPFKAYPPLKELEFKLRFVQTEDSRVLFTELSYFCTEDPHMWTDLLTKVDHWTPPFTFGPL